MCRCAGLTSLVLLARHNTWACAVCWVLALHGLVCTVCTVCTYTSHSHINTSTSMHASAEQKRGGSLLTCYTSFALLGRLCSKAICEGSTSNMCLAQHHMHTSAVCCWLWSGLSRWSLLTHVHLHCCAALALNSFVHCAWHACCVGRGRHGGEWAL